MDKEHQQWCSFSLSITEMSQKALKIRENYHEYEIFFVYLHRNITGTMTTYDYQIYYDNGTVSELKGCLERIDLDEVTTKPFFTINLPVSEVRKVGQRILVNVAHVTNINEFEQVLNPDNADDIKRALVLANDDRTKAARILGISERTLYRKMQIPGFNREEEVHEP